VRENKEMMMIKFLRETRTENFQLIGLLVGFSLALAGTAMAIESTIYMPVVYYSHSEDSCAYVVDFRRDLPEGVAAYSCENMPKRFTDGWVK
jgi:hypothetical protein